MESIINEFWRLQKVANLTNSQAAEFCGVNLSTVKRWRNGTCECPKAVIKLLEYRIEFGERNNKGKDNE